MSQVYPHQLADTTQNHHSPKTFTVWKKALFFTGIGFTAFDSSGNLIFRVEDSTPTVKRELLIMDALGNPLLLLRRKVVSLHHRWNGYICNGDSGKVRVFSIKRSSIISATTSIDVFVNCSYANYFPRQCDYHIEGSFKERSCAIYNRSRSIVAQVKRKRASCDVLLDKDVFSVVIYQGFDPALILSWIVVVDIINSEDLNRIRQTALYSSFRSYQLSKKGYLEKEDKCSNSESEALEKSGDERKGLRLLNQ
ncbi:hypothetical protein SUGI_0218860 [Cryptomeria japonica]|uniref:protein LURP-one-related 12 n=1 Tax=Cryptomeria japonica TaxID=3369 RepID=UPI002408CADF|nr:protein LURP-one-related 12 [Cryptomeria japonica]GLJ13716.1 hypothetical protein SUGI_0218860 [Cryptomeria japonica]